MKNDRHLNLSPSPSSLIESLRDIGYSMETAVADIIDNSITADAGIVWIRFAWNSDNPWLAIIDDGCGMSEDELIDAMRFGSKSPRAMRSANDLGRFGLGMKTASFSQCRHLTVLSKKSGLLSCCAWDLDQITRDNRNEWLLGVMDTDELQNHKPLFPLYQEYMQGNESGTIVLWEKFDRIESRSSSEARERLFDSLMDDTRKHLELVFHRFLSYEVGKGQVVISMNGDELEAFNPFNPSNLATQELAEQRFSLDGQEIVVQPYILPHHNKVSQEEYDKYAGDGGYLQNQGLYIYRNRRLIIKGTWFRLIQKMELNKLIRIRVDIPNTLDHLWRIDVKKSNAAPPESVRRELRQIIGKIEIKGRRVYMQRGQKLSASAKIPIWNRRAAGGSIVYEINREHPLLKQLLQSAPSEQVEQLKNTICLIESRFPTDLFYNDFSNNPEQVQSPNLGEETLESMLDTFISFGAPDGIVSSEIVATLLSTEPFSSNKEFTEVLLRKKGYLR